MELIRLKKLDILLNSDRNNYISGETINGSVKISLDGVIDLSAVNIVLRSMAEVKWIEIHGSNFKEGYVFRDSEEYLNVVYEIPDNIRKTVITAGEHKIPFEYKLPDDIPSSYKSPHGFIDYWIQVIIIGDSPKQEIFSENKYFTVESPLRNGLHLSVGGGTEKDFGSLSLECGSVRIDASIRKKGCIPGDTIEVHCLVTNKSTVAVIPRAFLNKTQIFMAKERHKTRESPCEPMDCEKVNSGETRDQIIKVHIPKGIPLSIKTRLITVKYFIHVTLDIPFTTDLHLNLPIIVTNQSALDEKSA